MKTVSIAAAAVALGLSAAPALVAAPAMAASFDCAKAKTPFETAICDNPALSAQDEVLAKAYQTSVGGLTAPSAAAMLADQRQWLDYAQSACTSDAEPLTSGAYDEDGLACLADKFDGRIDGLEQSRMISGHRFFIKSAYGALPDPDQAGTADAYWKVATHELVVPLLDADDPEAPAFNAFVMANVQADADMKKLIEGSPNKELDARSETSLNVDVKEVAGTGRITLTQNTYYYGHGAAHGDYTISFLHYLTNEQRALAASDIFTGKGWEKTLADAAWAQLQIEHAERLQAGSVDDIADIVIDPTRWDLSDIYGLVIQFEPYEVASYADGAPTITIPWEKLADIAAQDQSLIIYGQ